MRMPTKPPAKQTPTLKQSASSTNSEVSMNGDIHTMIAEAAYHRASQRGFEPGHELEDWLSAEAELTGHSLSRTPIGVDSLAVGPNELNKD
jgi:hypothetical protein